MKVVGRRVIVLILFTLLIAGFFFKSGFSTLLKKGPILSGNGKKYTSISCYVWCDLISWDVVISGRISEPVSSTVSIWWRPSFLEPWRILANVTSNSDGSYYYRVSIFDVSFYAFYMASWPGDDENYGATSDMTPMRDPFAAIVYFRYVFPFLMSISIAGLSYAMRRLKSYRKEGEGSIPILLLDTSISTMLYSTLFYTILIGLKLSPVHYVPNLSLQLSRLIILSNIIAFLDALFAYYPNIFCRRISETRRRILLTVVFMTGFLISFL